MGTAFVIDVEMVTEICIKCGMTFAAPSQYIKMRRNDHKSFCCPEGHSQYYPDESDLEIERKRVTQLTQKTERLERCCYEAKDKVFELEAKIPLIRGGYKSQLLRLKKKG